MSNFKILILQLSIDLLDLYPVGYNVLPVASPHDVVDVYLEMALYHIVAMNERKASTYLGPDHNFCFRSH